MPRNVPYEVKKTKTGLGLFATRPIPKGKRIIEYFGPLISNEEVVKSSRKYFFGVNKRWSIDGSPRANIARYINHSCTPNAEPLVSQRRRVWIWSRKKIKPGEEITYDYGKEYFEGIIEPMGCKCEKCDRDAALDRMARPERPKAIQSAVKAGALQTLLPFRKISLARAQTQFGARRSGHLDPPKS